MAAPRFPLAEQEPLNGSAPHAYMRVPAMAGRRPRARMQRWAAGRRDRQRAVGAESEVGRKDLVLEVAPIAEAEDPHG